MLKVVVALSLAFVLGCFIPETSEAQQSSNQSAVRSPRLITLEKLWESRDAAALDNFWREVKERGAPLVEPISGDAKHVLVTFLWRGGNETRNVVAFSAFTTGHPCCSSYSADQLAQGEMKRLLGTDVWFKTIRLPYDVRFTYYLSPNDSLVPDPQRTDKDWATQQPDPLNPHQFTLSHDHLFVASVVELPGAPPFPWFDERPDVPKGRTEEHDLSSKALGDERHFWVYTPPGYTAGGEAYDLLVLIDGSAYAHMLHGLTILDNLLAAGKIRPVIAVMLDPIDRAVELGCYETFNDFLVRELIPWAREHYHITSNPDRIIIGGQSLGGLAAAFAALRHPEVFGNVLSQSGGFSWDPQAPCGLEGCDAPPKVDEQDLQFEWIIRQFAASPKLPIRFSLTVGRFEWQHKYPNMPSPLQSNRHMRDVLSAKGYTLAYKELPAGDELFSVAVALPDSLSFLLNKDGTNK